MADLKGDLEKCFDLFDSDKSGYVEHEELWKIVQDFNAKHKGCAHNKTEEDIKEFIAALDRDSDNKVSKSEFVEGLLKFLKG